MMQHDAIVAAARGGEFDRYAAALLAPVQARDDLMVLAAFAAELARIAPATQREPTMGAIRLQWWRESIEKGEATGNPVLDALMDAAGRRLWPRETLLGIVDAHAHDGLADPHADDGELLETLRLKDVALFGLAAATVVPASTASSDVAEAAGLAYGMARALAFLPQALARKHVPFPQSWLPEAGVSLEAILAGGQSPAVHRLSRRMAELARGHLALAQAGVAKLPRAQRVAFLPLALVRPYLRIAERQEADVTAGAIEPSHVSRLWRIARMHVFGVI